MGRNRFPRDFYVPKGAVRVADKASGAVAYLCTDPKGRPRAVLFSGNRDKPDSNCWYRSEAQREVDIKRHFAAARARIARREENRAERKAAGPGLIIGDIVNTCWGYEQTNREFFEVIEVAGKMVTLREIDQVRESTGWETGRAMPQSGNYIGEPIRRLARNGHVKIDNVRGASKWNTSNVAGVPMGDAVNWSSYH